MSFDFYERNAMEFAIYPNIGSNIIYPTLKLCGESGEVAEKIGKIIRDKDSLFTSEDKLELAKELGDVLWYVTALSLELGFTLKEIAQINLTKLNSRKAKGTLQGSGDGR